MIGFMFLNDVLGPEQSGHILADNILKCIYFNENVCIFN